MATKSQSLELIIRNAKGVRGETNVITFGAGLELWLLSSISPGRRRKDGTSATLTQTVNAQKPALAFVLN